LTSIHNGFDGNNYKFVPISNIFSGDLLIIHL
jgi:hypothetical protein